jgi:hypothetical protein
LSGRTLGTGIGIGRGIPGWAIDLAVPKLRADPERGARCGKARARGDPIRLGPPVTVT